MLIGGMCLARDPNPSRNVVLSATDDALIVHGFNFIGLKTIRTFKNWNDTESYLTQQGLHLPNIVYARNGFSTLVHTKPSHTGKGLVLSWEDRHGRGRGSVATPDLESAQIVAEYIRYEGLNSSLFGFSIPLQN